MEPFGTIIGLVIAGIVGYMISQDATKRGMSGALWGIAVFLLCIVFLPIYLVVRKPIQED